MTQQDNATATPSLRDLPLFAGLARQAATAAQPEPTHIVTSPVDTDPAEASNANPATAALSTPRATQHPAVPPVTPQPPLRNRSIIIPAAARIARPAARAGQIGTPSPAAPSPAAPAPAARDLAAPGSAATTPAAPASPFVPSHGPTATPDALHQPWTPEPTGQAPTPPGDVGSLGGVRDLTVPVDWALVADWRRDVAMNTSELTGARADRITYAIGMVNALIEDHTAHQMAIGEPLLDIAQRTAMRQATIDALFGAGRLEPHINNPLLENIEVIGCDNVTLEYADGTTVQAGPVAESDEELIVLLQQLASAESEINEGRAFDSSTPKLHLTLPGGARLAANAWITPRPAITIRLHRIVLVTLDDLVHLGMIDQSICELLRAAVRARRTIVVSAPPGLGKTTLLRALATEISGSERLITIESEYELHLSGQQFRRLIPFQARPGVGEPLPNGQRAGAYSLSAILEDSLRHNSKRFIVGEIRGGEILTFMEAMEGGPGSMTTVHSMSAESVPARFADLARKHGDIPESFIYRETVTNIDLIVQLDVDDRRDLGGRKHRFVSEIVEPTRGDGPHGTAMSYIYRAGEDGRALPTGESPSFTGRLTSRGYDRGWLVKDANHWQYAIGDEPIADQRYQQRLTPHEIAGTP